MYNTIMFIIFITVVISIYSLLNYYFLRKQQSILTTRSLPAILLKLVLFTIILTPVATIVFSRNEIPVLAAFTGFTGYSWLAFLFLFLVIHGLVDIILFGLEKAGFIPPKYMAKEIFIITMLISVSVLTYGFFEAKQIQIKKVTIETNKLPAEIKKLKIVQISDVHFSPLISVNTAKKIYKLVMSQNPDLIVSTGDLLDIAIRNYEEVAKVMRKLQAPMGKYAVTGNHEFIADIKYSEEFTKKAGFKMIRNKTVSVSNILNLAGVDDLSAARFGVFNLPKESEIFKGIDTNKYTILLKHQPRVEINNTNKYDLQLSGHTHAGQIFPFTLLVRIVFPYLKGMYQINESTKLYVNVGTGTWGPPIRFLVPPEITVIELRNSKYN